MIERATDAKFINSVVNDPSIYPFVCGYRTEPLDLTEVIARPEHHVLVGEYGGIIFFRLTEGLYEAHTSVLPSGRGEWTQKFGQEALDYLFTKTDALEILTKCPNGNVAAIAGARAIGARKEFTTRPLWPLNGEIVPVTVYGMTVHDWALRSDAMASAGREMHALLNKYGVPVDHADDDDHDRYSGAARRMLENGQAVKAARFYFRWAVMSGYRPFVLLGIDPPRIDIGSAILRLDNGVWDVVRPQPMTAA